MSGIKDAIKILDKTPEEIEQIKSDVKSIGLPEETVTVIIYGLSLIIWLPKLLLEQRVTIARLKELLFGKSQRKSKSKASKGGMIRMIFTKTSIALWQPMILMQLQKTLILLMKKMPVGVMDDTLTLSIRMPLNIMLALKD